MKRFSLTFMLSVVLAVGYAQTYSFSEVCETGQTLYYQILDNTIDYTVKLVAPNPYLPYWDEGTEPAGDLRIPDVVSHDGIEYTVTAIDDNALCECDQLNSVVLGAFVESIGEHAFIHCTSLTTVDFGSSLVGVGFSAFYGCTSLESLMLPEPLRWIGEAAFYNCSGVASISFPSTLDSISFNAFAGCSGFTSLIIPQSVSYVDYWAFHGNTSLVSMVVEEGNSVYDSRNGCNAIVETASNKIIRGCKTTVIPDNVVTIGKAAFHGCVGMTEMVLPNSVEVIEETAFSGCTDLVSIHIPNSVTTIGGRAFTGCGLVSVNIPRSVTSIGWNPFAYCQNLVAMTVDPGNSVYDSRDHCNAIIRTSQNSIISGCKATIIPSSVVRLNEGSFYNCRGLTSIIIPRSVRVIGKEAFYYCSDLVSITLPASVATLGEHAFAYCTGLRYICARRSSCPTTGFGAMFAIDRDVPVHIPMGSLHSYENAWGFYLPNLIEEYMLPEGAEWWYEMRDVAGNRSYQRLEYINDTLMDDVSIKVLVKESLPVGGQPVVSREYVYEDSCRLYRWNGAEEAFGLLYDYSAQQGDEWQVSFGDDEITVHVDTVMVMSLGDADYDAMRVHDDRNVMSGEIICGVGHRKSFFPEFVSSPFGLITDGMRCFWKDDNLLFQFGDVDCDAILSVDETDNQNGFTFFPNPTSGTVTIAIEGMNHVAVISLLGQVLYETKVQGDEALLDFSQLESGVYLVCVITENGAVYKQLSVQK